MNNAFYTESVTRGKREHGSKWDTTALDAAPQFAAYFGTGQRIRVTRTYESGETDTRTGRVSRTTGWRPAFLLMSRSNALGSSDVLGPDDVITAVQDSRGRYVPVPGLRPVQLPASQE